MRMTLWHAKRPTEIFDMLKTSAAGLSAEDAARRLEAGGPNALPETKPDSVLAIFVRQFQSPLIYLLLAAGVTIFLLGETADALIILAVLLFNAIVGTIQEGHAQNTLRALKQYVSTTATVLRDGRELIIPDSEVVQGDILLLREGEKVPADARILHSSGLKADEAALTGESIPVSKVFEQVGGHGTSAAEQRNMTFKGTHIVAGSGRAVVVATGIDTVIGSIAKTVSAIDTEMPLKANIRYLSRAIIAVVAAISATLIGLGLLRGETFVTIFSTVVSLAVSIIPEGLPIVMTLVLATGVWRMSKRHALVKKLQAVEALGQARVIAVDKTGTITKNELVIREVWTGGKLFSLTGVGYEPGGAVMLEGITVDAANHPELLLAGKMAALVSSAHVSFSEEEGRWRVIGDPTEAAIQVFGEKVGFKKEDAAAENPILFELPFDYRRKYHATVFSMPKGNALVVSGAPEAILSLCSRIRLEKKVPFSQKARETAHKILSDMSERGLRVVAIALREKFDDPLEPESIRDLVFLGFFGMQDVLRVEVAEAMERASAAGIRVVMITGDYEITARAIAKDAGIWREGDEVLTGAAIETLSDEELAARIAGVTVYARVTPDHKLRIINAYKQRGETIAMTGDGVNDAPPLVAADLGVAMGKIGTEVAKEAADIVLLDDNFGSIVSAIEEGRTIYKTIKKVILYLFSTSLGEVLAITGALLLGYPLPLLAAQIIWLNLVTDGFLDVALAMEPKEEGLLSGTFERPNKYLIDGFMIRRMILMALPMAAGALVLFGQYVPMNMAKGWTVSLTVLAVFQWFNAWNCRSEEKSIFQMGFFSNMYLVGASILVILLQLSALYTPFFQKILHTVPLSLTEWLIIIATASSILFVEEIRKFLYRRQKRGGAEGAARSSSLELIRHPA